MENTQTDIRNLREKTEESYVRKALKRSLLGGYEKSSVLNIIGELREAGQKERNAFYQQIGELSSQLDALKKEKGETERKLAEVSHLQEQTLREKDGYYNDVLILKRKTANQEERTAELEKACEEYEQKIESMTVDYEEFQAAGQIREQYDILLADYRKLAESKDESVRKITLLQQSAETLSQENEKLSKGSEALNRKYAELLSRVRSVTLCSGTHFGEYEEKVGFSLDQTLKFMESSLENLREMKNCSEQFGQTFKTDFDPFKKGE